MERLNAALVAMRRILRAADIHAKRLSRATNLKTSQLLVIQTIDESGEMTVGEIAEKVNLAQASVTAIIDRLQESGLLSRQRGDSDKRKVYVHLTEQGLEVLNRAPTALHDRFSERFSALEGWEQLQMVAVLERVAAMMDADRIEAAPVLDHEQIERDL
ncbi:MAG: MarR family transcriptional regulator [Rhodovibrionaceae bacterium]